MWHFIDAAVSIIALVGLLFLVYHIVRGKKR